MVFRSVENGDAGTAGSSGQRPPVPYQMILVSDNFAPVSISISNCPMPWGSAPSIQVPV